jgi:hypothetical protein
VDVVGVPKVPGPRRLHDGVRAEAVKTIGLERTSGTSCREGETRLEFHSGSVVFGLPDLLRDRGQGEHELESQTTGSLGYQGRMAGSPCSAAISVLLRRV